MEGRPIAIETTVAEYRAQPNFAERMSPTPRTLPLWRAPYTEGEAGELQELLRACRSQGLQFIYGIAPGLDITHSNRKDTAALRRKASQLSTLGCDRFAIRLGYRQAAIRQFLSPMQVADQCSAD